MDKEWERTSRGKRKTMRIKRKKGGKEEENERGKGVEGTAC